MFFEDEKDIIKEGTELQVSEDGTVTWEDVLSDDDDDLVIEDLDTKSKKTSKKGSKENKDEAVEFIQQDNDNDIDDQELMNILSNDPSDNKTEEDVSFDIDSQLQNASTSDQEIEEDASFDDDIIPRKIEKKKSGSPLPFLIFVLFTLAIGYGIYYGYDYVTNMGIGKQDLNKNQLSARTTTQQNLDNMSQEDFQKRTQKTQDNIPVVNEDQVEEIKPETSKQDKKAEKKQVIDVIPTGRPNPFMPISKYAATSISESAIYAKTGIPQPPETYGIQEEETVKLLSISVSGIMYDESKPSAIITYDNNDYFVQKGDRLDKYKIVNIAKNYVVIAYGSNIYKANVGEEFKIKEQFEGSAEFIPNSQGGGRHYYSKALTEEKDSVNSERRYVSEEDIKIRAK